MATLYQRGKDGLFGVDWIEKGKRHRKSLHTKDPRKAEELLAKLEARLTLGLAQVPSADLPHITLSKFTESYLEHVKTRHGPSYLVNVRHALAHLAKSLGNPALTQVSRRAVEEHVTTLRRAYAVATVNGEIRILRAALHKAIDWGYLRENPFRGVKFLRDPSADSKIRFLSEEEITRLLATTEGQLHDVFATLFYTGLRREELVTLWWEDLDFERDLLHVRIKDWVDEQGVARHWHPKGKRERTIPIHPALKPILAAQPRRGRTVFTNEEGNSLHTSLGCLIDRWQKRTGWRVTCHMLRHTFASHLVQKNVSLYLVGELLGHSGPEVTKIYARLVPKQLGHVVALLGPAPPLAAPAVRDGAAGRSR